MTPKGKKHHITSSIKKGTSFQENIKELGANWWYRPDINPEEKECDFRQQYR